jgi:predicted nucleic acid-binding Zn ribbon protein
LSHREPGPIGDALRTYFSRRGLSKRVKESNVVLEWEQIVGAQMAGVTVPRSVDGSGTLWVEVASAAWMQELQLMSPTILRELARGGYRIKYIRWMVGGHGSPHLQHDSTA